VDIQVMSQAASWLYVLITFMELMEHFCGHLSDSCISTGSDSSHF
jgi:hypothetical protein